MNRRQLLVVAGSAIVGSGCTEVADEGSDGDPTSGSATESDSPTPTQTTSPQTQTVDCTVEDLFVANHTGREVTVTITVTDPGSRYKGGSPTPTTAKHSPPTETPVETFTDTITLPVDGHKSYKTIPVNSGNHIIDVQVEDGPATRFDVLPRYFANNRSVSVSIDEDEIFYSFPTEDPPSSCN